MIISQLSTCEACRDSSCDTCKRFKRRQARRKTMAKKNTCECGSKFPMHLAEIITNHVCICSRGYKIEKGKFVFTGMEKNPFAEYDREQAAKKKARG